MATKVAVEKTKAQNVSLDGPLLDALNAEVKKMNGNFLINFGPKANGSLDENELRSYKSFKK